MTDAMAAWHDYLGSLELLSAIEADGRSGREQIDHEYQAAGARLQREHSVRHQELKALNDRAEAFSFKLRQFAQSVGATAPTARETALVPVNRIRVLLDDYAKRLRKAQEARNWVARFAQSEAGRSSEESRRLDRERLAEEARARDALGAETARAARQADSAAQATLVAGARRRRVNLVVAGAALVLLVTVILIVTIVR